MLQKFHHIKVVTIVTIFGEPYEASIPNFNVINIGSSSFQYKLQRKTYEGNTVSM